MADFATSAASVALSNRQDLSVFALKQAARNDQAAVNLVSQAVEAAKEANAGNTAGSGRNLVDIEV